MLKIVQTSRDGELQEEKVKKSMRSKKLHKFVTCYSNLLMVIYLASRYSWMLISWSSFLKVFRKTYTCTRITNSISKTKQKSERNGLRQNSRKTWNSPQGSPISCFSKEQWKLQLAIISFTLSSDYIKANWQNLYLFALSCGDSWANFEIISSMLLKTQKRWKYLGMRQQLFIYESQG